VQLPFDLLVRREQDQRAQGIEDHLQGLPDEGDGQDDGDARIHVGTDEGQGRADQDQIQQEYLFVQLLLERLLPDHLKHIILHQLHFVLEKMMMLD